MNKPTWSQRWWLARAQRALDAERPMSLGLERAARRDAALAQHLAQQQRLDALLRRSAAAQRATLEPMTPAAPALRLPPRAVRGSVISSEAPPITRWAWLGPIVAAAVLGLSVWGGWFGKPSPVVERTGPTARNPSSDLPSLTLLVDRARHVSGEFNNRLQTLEASWSPVAPATGPGEVLMLAAAAGEDPLQREWLALRQTVEGTVRKVADTLPRVN